MESQLRNLKRDLIKKLGRNSVLTDDLFLIAYGADASCYHKTPKIIIKPKNELEVIYVLKKLNSNKIPVTFRAAGTSLSGQSLSDSVLLIINDEFWNKVEVIDNGKFVKTQPGVSGQYINKILKTYNLKFGPDPASINSARIGGILSNNASGMSCGIHSNCYATIQSARIIFSDGTILDTQNEISRINFLRLRAELIDTIKELQTKIRQNPYHVKLITEKYSIKNTTGYGLNSFLDFDDPIDIILHLIVGSEGTLGLISEATFTTIPIMPERASGIIYFNNLKEACNAALALKNCETSAIELLDREALRSIENKPVIPELIKSFGNQTSALLIDIEAWDKIELRKKIESIESVINNFQLECDFVITEDPSQINKYWEIRNGVFPSVGGMRAPGTIVIIEDVAVAIQHLPAATNDIRKLLNETGFKNAVIYGHALYGNLHFILALNFNNSEELKNYKKLIESLTKLIVIKYNGSLKAEHGTGLNMAPFVRLEWGDELYSIMKKIKAAFDPERILNPGVIINDDNEVHLKNLKYFPNVDEIIDRCIECGFCEINCLSAGYTLSARQRIVVQREIIHLSSTSDKQKKAKKITNQFKFAGNISCAGDGLCSLSCPLDIDTGLYIKKYRNEKNYFYKRKRKLALLIAENFSLTKKIVRNFLGIVNVAHIIFGTRVFIFITKHMRKLSFNHMPAWSIYMPQTYRFKDYPLKYHEEHPLKIVYFPSCINQIMGPSRFDNNQQPLVRITVEILEKAGYQVIIPKKTENLCCGTPWESKGFIDIADMKSAELEKVLLKASNNGLYPILCDTSPCILRMRKVMDNRLKLYEPVEFIHDFLLDKLNIKRTNKKIAFHITCSSTKMNLTEKFKNLARTCTNNPVFPEEVGCCGFAGDKGFLHPELNDWALRKLDQQVQDCTNGYSNSRTCEIGLSKNSNIFYKSIMYLIHEISI